MNVSERERRLRRQFGPAPGPARPAPRRRSRPALWAVAAALGVLLLGGLAAVFLALTPMQHVAPGCSWWSARSLGEVTPGQRGCLRGYVREGGELADSGDAGAVSLSFAYGDPDQPSARGACPFRPGDAVVVRYHSVFDDGRTIVVVEDCR